MNNYLNKFFLSIIIPLILINFSYGQWIESDIIGGHSNVSALGIYNNTIFAGTDRGIYLSTDFGNKWTSSVNVYNVTSFASTAGKVFAATDDFGVILSINSGLNWHPIHNGLTNLRVKSLAFKGSKLFAGTAKPKNSSIKGGLYATTDDGVNWNDAGLSGLDVNVLIVKDSNIYAGTSSGVYFSSNGGNTWDSINTGMNNSQIFTLAAKDSILFAGSNHFVYISTNNGVNWENIKDFGSVTIQSFIIIKNNLYVGTNRGIYFSDDNAKNWISISSQISVPSVTSLLFLDSIIFAGTYINEWSSQGRGVLASSDWGISWNLKTKGLTKISETRAILDFGEKLVCATYGDGIFFSTDEGESWFESTLSPYRYIGGFASDGIQVLAGSPNGMFISYDSCGSWKGLSIPFWGGIALKIVNNNFYASFDKGLSISTDGGINWYPSNLYSYDIYAISLENNGEYFFAGTNNGLYFSSDNGWTWNFLETGVYNPNGASINTLVKNSNNQIFLGSPCQGVYTSTDNGSNWTELNNGLTNKCVYSLVVRDSDIFAGTWYGGGIFYSSDAGFNWKQIGLNSYDISSLFIKNDKIYAGTSEGIFWRSISGITGIKREDTQVPNLYSLFQNYPNPFNPATKIKYQIPKAGFVSLKVYDLLGREVATLVHEEKLAGRYEVEFNGTNLPSGVYFYKLEAGGNIFTKKLVLLK
jgi:photosystem II stability/assembly factor-like uncharacterized protein